MDTVEVRHRVGLPLPVREPLGQWDTVGDPVDVKHRLGEPEEELEWEGDLVALGEPDSVMDTVEVRHSEGLPLPVLLPLGQ